MLSLFAAAAAQAEEEAEGQEEAEARAGSRSLPWLQQARPPEGPASFS